jgi:hypothetical protein
MQDVPESELLTLVKEKARMEKVYHIYHSFQATQLTRASVVLESSLDQ